jgi:hypothetical protein
VDFATIFVIGFLVFLGAAIFVAERSLRRQQGSGIKRTEQERRALAHTDSTAARSAGGQGV